MRRIRVVVVSAAAFVLGVVGIAWAMTVILPTTLRPKGMILVNELGQVLFGPAAPAKVEVINLTPGSGSDTLSVWTNVGDNTGCNVTGYTVPVGKALVITDIEVQSPTLRICDSVGTRLKMNEPGATFMKRSFTSGVVIGSGEPVKFQTDGEVTIMGRLVPAS